MSARAWAVVAVALALVALPACGGGNGAGDALGTAPGEQEFPPTETGAVPPGGFAQDEVELSLEDQETNDIIGSAVLTPEDASTTQVRVFLDVYPEGGGAAEIRAGRCEEPESAVAHEVGALEEGQTEGTVDAALEDMLAGEFALWAVGPDETDLGCALIAPYGSELD